MGADRLELVAIFTGGCLGALGRAGLVEELPYEVSEWPWSTFIAT